MDHRLRVQGVVTFRDPWSLFMQQETNGLYVRALTAPVVDVGDRVDVVGFVAPGRHGPVLTDAVIRRMGQGIRRRRPL